MLVVDLMTREVITVTRITPVLDALKLMQEHELRRLPVVDEERHPVGVVSQRSIERLKPQSGIPLIWQSGPWAARHIVAEVMNKNLITVTPSDTVEYATHKAQLARVGSLVVVEDGKLVGVVTTNDIFYKVVNPILGIGEPGCRVVIIGGGNGQTAEKVISIVNQLGIGIKIIWGMYSPTIHKNNLVIHLDVEDGSKVVDVLTQSGYDARIVNR
jgi:acetoin utilization protein AcuB